MGEEHREPVFSSTDALDITEYPRISRWAIVALLLGLLSVTALTSQALWCLPVAGVIAAVVAMQLIARAEKKTLGRRAAMIGLVLSLIFTGWVPVRHYIRVSILSKQARERAIQWVAYIQQGRLHEAHQLRLEQHSRQEPNADLQEYYENDEVMSMDFEEFSTAPHVRKIVELGDTVQPRYVRDVSITSERMMGSKLDVITQLFHLETAEPGGVEATPLVVEMVRERRSDQLEDTWHTRNAEDPRDRDKPIVPRKRPIVLDLPPAE